MGRDEVMEEIEERQKEKKLKREIVGLKEKLGLTGKEPKKKKLKLEEVVNDMYRENYIEWYTEKKKREKKKKN